MTNDEGMTKSPANTKSRRGFEVHLSAEAGFDIRTSGFFRHSSFVIYYGARAKRVAHEFSICESGVICGQPAKLDDKVNQGEGGPQMSQMNCAPMFEPKVTEAAKGSEESDKSSPRLAVTRR
ncbi:MAG: hypothetical protein IID44_22255 [Planctomycetes bacterium]|nr:hypothetical protein [Planctomycetota bacterium]